MSAPKLAKCRGCGANILWIKTTSGKSMPCDPQLVTVHDFDIEAGKWIVLVLENGVVTTNPHIGMAGYTSHFATCPKAAAFKKRRTINEETKATGAPGNTQGK